MEFLPQPHGATCTKRQSCATARGQGSEIYLAGAPWRNARAKQALTSAYVLVGEPGAVSQSQIKSFWVLLKSF